MSNEFTEPFGDEFGGQASPTADDQGIPYGDDVLVYPSEPGVLDAYPSGNGEEKEWATGGVISAAGTTTVTGTTFVVRASDGQQMSSIGEGSLDDMNLEGWIRVSSNLYINPTPGSYWVAIEST